MLFSYGYGRQWNQRLQKNAGKLTTILIAMPLEQYGAMHIARWSASVASCKATICHHRMSARAVLPRQPPWLTISNETQKH
jgi:hypothetical protein